jgi:hypothetical protein
MSASSLAVTCASLAVSALASNVLDAVLALLKLPWLQFSFLTSSDALSTNRALDFLEGSGSVRSWLVQGNTLRPVGWVVNVRGLWVAHVGFTEGDRKQAETTSFHVQIWWPTWWAAPPASLLPGPSSSPIHSLSQAFASSVELGVLERTLSWCPSYETMRRRFDAEFFPEAAKRAAEEIAAVVNRSRRRTAVVHLCGPPSSGKTSAAIQAAIDAGATLCMGGYSWGKDGDSFAAVVRDADPTAERPLYVVLNEGDAELIERLRLSRRNKDGSSGERPAEGRSKSSTIQFLDDVVKYKYENVVIVITGNLTFPEFELQVARAVTVEGAPELDFSITKEGRIHAINVGGGSEYERSNAVRPPPSVSPPSTASICDSASDDASTDELE